MAHRIPTGRLHLSTAAALSCPQPSRLPRLRAAIDRHPTFYPWVYAAWIFIAEICITFVNLRLGLFIHCALLLILPAHAMLAEGKRYRATLSTLITAPLIRIMSIVLPLVQFPIIDWYLMVSLPVFIACFFIVRLNHWSWSDIGLTPGRFWWQPVIALSGFAIGFGESLVLPVNRLAPELTIQAVFMPFLILLVSTGFFEELVFRGLMQRASFRLFSDDGIFFNACVFASLHVGYKDLADLIYVFGVGLFFGILVRRSGSIIGTTFSHGLANTTLYILVPLLSHQF